MADTHEEQLLSDLLREIRDADRATATPAMDALEVRVLAGWDAGGGHAQRWKPLVVAGLAAALVMAVAGAWLLRTRPEPVVASSQLPDTSSQLPAPRSEPPAMSFELSAVSPESPITQSSIAQSPIPQPPITQSPITQSPTPQSPIPNPQSLSSSEFLPLRPLTEQELAGPFQLVRVRVPLASLGGLTSPLQHPGEIVNADLLLGEDGLARGIRIASDGSNYPRRFR